MDVSLQLHYLAEAIFIAQDNNFTNISFPSSSMDISQSLSAGLEISIFC